MNDTQKTIIVIGVVVVLLMGLVPPWKQVLDYGQYREVSLGYSPIVSPPRPNRFTVGENRVSYVSLDVTRLAVQWVTVFLVVLGLSLAFKNRPGTQVENRSGEEIAKMVRGIRTDDPADD